VCSRWWRHHRGFPCPPGAEQSVGEKHAALSAIALVAMESPKMLAIVGVVLLVAWLLGISVFHVADSMIHILIILAVVSLVMHFMRGRSAV
jgi:hypothetical protein